MNTSTLYKISPFIIALLILIMLMIFLRGNSNPPATSISQQELRQVRDVLSANKDTVRVNLLRSLDPQVKNTQGEILWNHDTQNGVLRMQGLPKHEAREKYQLWIYDLKRDNDHPVLAANFYGSKAENSSYLVAIKPTEPIEKAFKFVITKSLINHNRFEQAAPLLFAQP